MRVKKVCWLPGGQRRTKVQESFKKEVNILQDCCPVSGAPNKMQEEEKCPAIKLPKRGLSDFLQINGNIFTSLFPVLIPSGQITYTHTANL